MFEYLKTLLNKELELWRREYYIWKGTQIYKQWLKTEEYKREIEWKRDVLKQCPKCLCNQGRHTEFCPDNPRDEPCKDCSNETQYDNPKCLKCWRRKI